MDLIDYDGFIQRARDLIAYGQRFDLPELTQLGERDLAFWLERKGKTVK